MLVISVIFAIYISTLNAPRMHRELHQLPARATVRSTGIAWKTRNPKHVRTLQNCVRVTRVQLKMTSEIVPGVGLRSLYNYMCVCVCVCVCVRERVCVLSELFAEPLFLLNKKSELDISFGWSTAMQPTYFICMQAQTFLISLSAC
jgi:hypothetical protein